jgi:tyrosyl-tRNA synthetase
VAQFHGDEAARQAEEHFTRVVQKREVPLKGHMRGEGKATLTLEVQRDDIVSLIFDAKLAKSRSGAKRLLEQGAIDVDGQKLSSTHVDLKDGSIIKVGKRRFLRIIDANKRTWEIIES